jgi:hypothetical protein
MSLREFAENIYSFDYGDMGNATTSTNRSFLDHEGALPSGSVRRGFAASNQICEIHTQAVDMLEDAMMLYA